mmetsp:Transcript_24104/g.58802  ORF Transcript_24104/g.58802 Transcript_24104/m.58802 type:complete len:109 (-) Transcript_24104:66-392(-)|eukprot:CAMPEP_0198339564 /NCGR_PEP_ID=MMETSP1450-20131203/40846_1 /TAXON_ID=753684 ORGANISM="Madagascaria erythrocladiodes, Strain CCMP3234" /NCGR_SAMPLE_ID=MMETSP1450 /ASSEMBLY_ACC=CAM_ASM_001115 /LENGTH=108 /DNA_ID=CAMNT_0044044503 /DNA_START=110 /DNA_END=436 /DNA_ORIENTATION=-
MEPEGLTKKPWYRASMTRADADAFLNDKRDGSFIIRKSSQKDRLALSHKHHDGHIVHAILKVSYQGYALVDVNADEVWHPTVTKLLNTLKLNYHVDGVDYTPDGEVLK